MIIIKIQFQYSNRTDDDAFLKAPNPPYSQKPFFPKEK